MIIGCTKPAFVYSNKLTYLVILKIKNSIYLSFMQNFTKMACRLLVPVPVISLWLTLGYTIYLCRIFIDPFIFNLIKSPFYTEIVRALLDHDPSLSSTLGPSNVTPLISAVTRGHLEVVTLLLSRDAGSVQLSKLNGKNALHFAARQGHVEIVKALLAQDPQLARRTDKKGQTALHMAVKGTSPEVVKALVEADGAIVMLPDRAGYTALHIAARKKRAEVIIWLLFFFFFGLNFVQLCLLAGYGPLGYKLRFGPGLNVNGEDKTWPT